MAWLRYAWSEYKKWKDLLMEMSLTGAELVKAAPEEKRL